jgi:subtilase family protein
VPPGFDPTIWVHGSYPHLVNLGQQNTEPGSPVLPPLTPPDQPPAQTPDQPPTQPPTTTPDQPPPTTNNQTLPPSDQPPSQLLLVQDSNRPNPPSSPPDLVNTQVALTGPPQPPQTTQQQQSQQADSTTTGSINSPTQLNVGEGRYFFLPPAEETRLVVNEVVIQLPCDTPQDTLGTALTELRLTVVSTQCLSTSNMALYQLKMGDDQKLADVIRSLANYRIVVSAQANYVYVATQDPASLGNQPQQEGDSGQYVLEKLRLGDIHRRMKATNVPIAVIDSQIDINHPDLAGAVIDQYNATGTDEKPHPHGTGMAGAIASHRRLVGVAPGARLLAIRPFSTNASTAESTSFNILKGLDYAINNSVRIVNMSFAGPRDPELERAIKTAYDKGIVLIAAAGNAGPKSPPLYPAADKNVIAVTATDIDDKLFSGANRGNHIAVAAPGVDILVPAPAGTYQLTTGTSVATAHVSGLVALMIERNPRLTPADVRRILMQSAKKLGPNDQFGAGLIDPARALQLATPRSADATPPATTTGSVRTAAPASSARGAAPVALRR